jgi:hypothetical protein
MGGANAAMEAEAGKMGGFKLDEVKSLLRYII